MKDRPVEFRCGEFTVSTDRRQLDMDAVHGLVLTTLEGGNLSREKLEWAVENSVCFGVYDTEDWLIGFGRAVTDLATYAYLTNIVLDTEYRGQGLGRWLVECMTSHPDLIALSRIALVTLNARGFYEALGFGSGSGTLTYMELPDSVARDLPHSDQRVEAR